MRRNAGPATPDAGASLRYLRACLDVLRGVEHPQDETAFAATLEWMWQEASRRIEWLFRGEALKRHAVRQPSFSAALQWQTGGRAPDAEDYRALAGRLIAAIEAALLVYDAEAHACPQPDGDARILPAPDGATGAQRGNGRA